MEIFTYKNAKDFQKKFRVKNITARTDYLQQVKWAVLEDTSPHEPHPSLNGILFAMAVDLLPKQHVCESCGNESRLRSRVAAYFCYKA